MIKKSDIYILLPAFNEAKAIQEVIHSLLRNEYKNIIVINDGSSDNTAQIACQLGCKVISHPINRGAGAAIQTGLEFARQSSFSYIVLMDADGQHLSEDIGLLSHKMETTTADIVLGSRFLNSKNQIPTIKRWYNWCANRLTALLGKNTYSDSQSGFRMLNSKAINTIELNIDGFGFCSEMIWQAEELQLQVVEVPVQVIYSTYSQSKGQNLGKGLQTAFDLLMSWV